MTGVEILATQEVAIGYRFSWLLFFIIAAGIAVAMTLISCLSNGFYSENIVIGLITGVVFGVIISAMFAATATPSEYETQYKVTISDEVLMNEFLDRYEIVCQEGKIYTGREIE